MTPHISAQKGEIEKTVFLAGEPARVQFIAENFLTDAKLVSSVRNNFFYTGKYNGKPVTVGTSGMGVGSMGIFAFELFKFYDVDQIIRIGSSGAYVADMDLGDVILVKEAYTDSPYFAKANLGEELQVMEASKDLNQKILESAKSQGKAIREERIHTTDIFHGRRTVEELKAATGATCVEMEAFTLFVCAKRTNKKAACLVTISDSLVTEADLQKKTKEARMKAFVNMIEIALGAL